MKRPLLSAIATAVAVLALGAGAAFADGGGLKPSQAPTVTVGQHYFGNTSHLLNEGYYSFDFWKLPSLIANDLITVAWNSGKTELCVAEGVDDYSWGDNTCNGSDSFGVSDTGSSRDQISAKSSTTGAYFEFHCFYSDPCGPYDFTIESIQHKVGVDLKRIFTIPRNGLVRGSAVLANGQPVPNGVSFTLHGSWHGGKKAVSAATASNKGQLAFRLKLPAAARKQTVTLVVTRAQDSQYQAAQSAALRAKD